MGETRVSSRAGNQWRQQNIHADGIRIAVSAKCKPLQRIRRVKFKVTSFIGIHVIIQTYKQWVERVAVMSVTFKLEDRAMKPAMDDAAFDSVVAIIPALNEERSLPLVLGDLPKLGEVIVVDNGSTDRTADVAKQCSAHVITEMQRGYGTACLAGIAEIDRMIRAEGRSFEVVLFADADYSDHVDDVAKLLKPILAGEQDFVLGSRISGQREKGAMPPQSVYGNKFACWLMRTFVGENNYTDLGPLRAIRYSALQQLEMVDQNFGWTIEMQMKAIQQKLRTIEVPDAYRRRIGVSKISGTISGTFKAGSKIIYSVWKYR